MAFGSFVCFNQSKSLPVLADNVMVVHVTEEAAPGLDP